jgi:hypothetical protein
MTKKTQISLQIYKKIEKLIHTSLTLNDLSVEHDIIDFEDISSQLKHTLVVRYQDQLVQSDITKIYNI